MLLRLLRRVAGAVFVVAGVAWLALLGVALLQDDTVMLTHPHRRYVTTVALVEYRGSGCGRRAEIWIGRDFRGALVEVCDERVFGRGELGEVLDVGEPTWPSRLGNAFVVFLVLGLPAWLVVVAGYHLLRPGRRGTATRSPGRAGQRPVQRGGRRSRKAA